MRHHHKHRPEERNGRRDDPRGQHHGRRRHGGDRESGRPFDYGDLRLLALAMIAEQPRHGYELMKLIEDQMGGSYSPSPGVMYPTLAWLDDMGYAAAQSEGTGRKLYRITAEGEAFLAANRRAVDDLRSRIGVVRPRGAGHVPAPVLRGMEKLKLALRLRLRTGPIDQAAAESIAAALEAAAQIVARN
ncbi:MAG: PadR family transcriptional regulator [Acetobacteraceae bacterium]|nr:PadR family transcriptional regulator [Acetobacteraceae bacterium]